MNAVGPEPTTSIASSPPEGPESAASGPVDRVDTGVDTATGETAAALAQEQRRFSLPGYKIIRKIGQGGMGAVYLAHQLAMEREVALKVLPPVMAKKPGFKEQFFREARAAGRLSHPNIVAAIDCQEVDEICYLAMEYVDGEELSRKLSREGALPEAQAFHIARQIGQALSRAWQTGMVHRDVKPENFLVTAAGVAKLCDLGIVHLAGAGEAEDPNSGMAVGTPRYMSPEQAQGSTSLDWRSDMYSLGASLYHMLAGRPPYSGASGREIMRKHVNSPVPFLLNSTESASRGAALAVARMMAKSPDDRYESPEALLFDLEALEKGRPPRVELEMPSRRIKMSSRRTAPAGAGEGNPFPLRALAVAIGVAAIGLAIFFLARPGSKERNIVAPPPPATISPEEQAQTRYGQGIRNLVAGNYDQAETDFKEVFRTSADPVLTRKAREGLDKVYAATGRTGEALDEDTSENRPE